MSSSPARVDLQSAVAQADPAILLASLVSITGDASRVEEFAPHVTNELIRGQLRGVMAPGPRRSLNEWALDVLAVSSPANVSSTSLDDETFSRLACLLTGIPVATESLPFLREQGGFTSFTPTVPRTRAPSADINVLVIGAGMAGITMAAAARASGFEVQVLERNPEVGGVWWQNRYPGVGVDTHSKYYSLSFEVNAEWTNAYPEGDEFRQYLDRVARKHGVFDSIVFEADVSRMVWDEPTSRWVVTYTKDGQEIETTAAAVVTAAGYLTRPVVPPVPGVDTFEGAWFHSAEWDDEYDFTGKNVAVVGTGCTSVQIVDSLADEIASLTLFQRQPHWVVPPAEEPQIPEHERWLLQNVPTYSRWARLQVFLMIGDVNYDSVRFDEDWAATHELSISEANERGLQVAQAHLEESFADRPDLLEAMRPGFAFMGKRPIRDPGAYYSTLKRPTSTVVTTGLAEVRPEGPVDGDGITHPADVIVYATGFSLEYLSNIDIIGREGRKLAEEFGDTPTAYLGCQIPGFPNFFMTSGPNANPSHGGGHNFCVEAVVHYAVECLQTLVERDARSIEPTREALDAWVAEIRSLLADSVWMREDRATTYYRNAKGDVLLASPLRMEDYWNRLRQPDLTAMRID